METIKIFADIINFDRPNDHLKGQELTCCLTGEKFKRGDALEFRTSESFGGLENYVHPEEAQKRGYVLTQEAERDLYLFMHESSRERELSDLLQERGYKGEIRKVEKVTRRKILKFEELSFRRPIKDIDKDLPF